MRATLGSGAEPISSDMYRHYMSLRATFLSARLPILLECIEYGYFCSSYNKFSNHAYNIDIKHILIIVCKCYESKIIWYNIDHKKNPQGAFDSMGAGISAVDKALQFKG